MKMAKENIARFIDAAMTDKALAAKVAALAAEYGYAFSAAELLEMGEVRPLSDADAEKAAAGAPPGYFPPPLKPKPDRNDYDENGNRIL